jgi:hypothetical protein
MTKQFVVDESKLKLYEMSMINKTPSRMINNFMRITSVSQNSLEEPNNLNR